MMLAANDFMDNACRKRSVAGKAIVLSFLFGHLLVLIFTSIDLVIPFVRTIDATSNINNRMTDASQKSRRKPTTFSIEVSKYHDLGAPMFSETIPLNELVNTGPDPECNSTNSYKMTVFPSIQRPLIQNDSINPLQKIPKIIHMTAISRCMTEKIRANLKKWEALPDYTIYFHDDVAVDRLLSKYWPHFPHLAMAQRCSISGAAKADIWRYLVIWEYGGLYTDIDNAPGRMFDNGRVISEDDQAWFVVERVGVLSQYFMAGIPHHPFFFVALTTCLSRLIHLVENIGDQYVPYITGPGVTKAAMMIYMKDFTNFQTVQEGRYTGLDRSTLTVMGKKSRSQQYIKRESIPQKIHEYKAMHMKHFSHSKNNDFRDSCYEHLYKLAIMEKQD